MEKWWFAALGAGMLAGILAIGYVLGNGHTHEFNAPYEPPWGVLIATYEFFVLASGGLYLAVALGRLMRLPGLEAFAGKTTLAAGLALFIGLTTAAVELTQPLRLTFGIAGEDFYSAGRAALALFGLYLNFLVGASLALAKGHRNGAVLLALLGWGTALAGLYKTGDLLGLLAHSPDWHGPFFLVRCSLSALVVGGALLPLVVHLGCRLQGTETPPRFRRLMAGLARALILLIALFLGCLIVETFLDQPTAAILVAGPLTLNFWLFEAMLGCLLPAVLLLQGATRTPAGVLLAGLLVTVGQFFMHYDRVIAAQLGAGPEESGRLPQELLGFLPCIPKASIVVGAVSTFLLLFTLAQKLLPLENEDVPTREKTFSGRSKTGLTNDILKC